MHQSMIVVGTVAYFDHEIFVIPVDAATRWEAKYVREALQTLQLNPLRCRVGVVGAGEERCVDTVIIWRQRQVVQRRAQEADQLLASSGVS